MGLKTVHEGAYLYGGIDGNQMALEDMNLGFSQHIGGREILPVEIVLIEDIGIDEGQVSHTDAGKHLSSMSAQPAAADEGDTGMVQLQLLPDIDRIPIASIAQRQNARFKCLPLDLPERDMVLQRNRLLRSKR